MAEGRPNGGFEDAFAEVKVLSSTETNDEDSQEFWDLLRSLRQYGQLTFDRAVQLLRGRPEERVLGCELLNVLCNPDEGSWGAPSATALIDAFEGERDVAVLHTLANALGQARDPRGVTVLAQLAGHQDENIRFAVACAIPGCQTHEDGDRTAHLVGILLDLMKDEDNDVRDWATFGIGQLLNDDTYEIRAALVRRLDDFDIDTRWEAIVGLARRHDRRAVEPLREALATGAVPFFGVVASGWIADPGLLPLLTSLDAWEGDSALLEAVGRCDPDLQQNRIDAMTEFLQAFDDVPTDARRNYVPYLSCPVLEHEVHLGVEGADKGDDKSWDFERLLEGRCHGDVSLAIEAALSDLARLHSATGEANDPEGT
jgi:hypothetical protein